MRNVRTVAPSLNRAVCFAMCGAITVSILTIGVAGIFALPNGDEFCRADLQPLVASVDEWGQSASVTGYVVDSWQFWTGRWVSMWIETSALSNVDIIRAYPALLLGVWLAILTGLWLVVRSALPKNSAVFGTFLLFGLYWANMPGPGEALFWFTGAVENVLPVSMGGAAVALLASRRWFPVAAVFSILAPGLHELFGAILAAVLAIGAVMIWFRDRREAIPWIACALLTIASVTVAFTAPGNAVRAAYYVEPNVFSAFKLITWQLLQYLPDWTFSGSLILATLVILWTYPSAPWVESHFNGWRLAIIPAVTMSLVVAAIAAPTYMLSAPLAPRTIAGIFLIFLIGWLLTSVGVAQRVERRDRILAGICGIALSGALTLQGNTRAGLLDLKSKVAAWHNSMDVRYSTLRSGHGLVLVPPSSPAPSIFFSRDILSDPTDFRNVCMAHYFRVSGVSVTGADR